MSLWRPTTKERGGVSVYQIEGLAKTPARSSNKLSERQRVEAVLWIAKEPLGARKLAEFAGLEDATRVRTIVNQLNETYDRKGRAFQIRTVAGGYQMLTRPQFAKWIRRLQHVGLPERLSGPALETLAVIAYRQPMVRAEIDAIRGVHSGEVLRQLLEKDLVKIAGRSNDLGHPFLYATTRRFLKMFGLGSLEELPAAGQLRRRKSSDKDTPSTSPGPNSPSDSSEAS
ncbi:MAG: SMC-Scp complex subunit ScpB [Planctomycetaceae bacterium]|nr:SMC-Scp complex subunit ScpB [Planctomycetaceae bacterium]